MSRRPKLTPRDLMRVHRERQQPRGIACGRELLISGREAVVIVLPGPRGASQANLTPGVALRFAWGVIRAALGAWYANLSGGRRDA